MLDAIDLKTRYERLCEILARELEIIALERKISARVRKQMEKTQKEYYLREQIRVIQDELGEGADSELEEYRNKISGGKFPEYATEKLMKEVDRLAKLPFGSAEASVLPSFS